MGSWLRVGRRLEWVLVVFTVLCILLFGFLFTSRAPANIRWMVWIYVGGFCVVLSGFSLLLIRYLRRSGIITGTASNASRFTHRNRLKVYLAATAVTIISAIEQARVAALKRGFSATTGDIVFWNFTALAVLIAVLELIEWRKRSSASGDRR